MHAMAWTARNSEGYPAPVALAADAVVLTVRDGVLLVLCVGRGDGELVVPGGFVGETETPLDTVRRKLLEKTGVRQGYFEQLRTFADPGRDPRGWIATVAHLALVPPQTEPTDPAAAWLPARPAPALALDHGAILAAALERVEGKLWWSNVAVGILPGAFTLSQARSVYAAIAGIDYDPATFARDLKATGLIEPTGEQRAEGPGRPAALFRFVSADPEWGAGRRKRVALS
jgi:8-oxo-dGTP diphosphatase